MIGSISQACPNRWTATTAFVRSETAASIFRGSILKVQGSTSTNTGVNRILAEFGLQGEECHIINGHIPVESKKGESPIKCNGKLLIIDGGFSKAYQGKTGIAGYTLIYNSYGLVIAAHEPFESVEKAVQEGRDVHSHRLLVEHVVKRKTVADTDVGRSIQENIRELEKLLQAYREGAIVENA